VLNIAEVFPGKIRILVVDNDSDLRLTLCEYLESRNFAVSSARNGTEAVNWSYERSALIDSRLEKIESLLGTLVTKMAL